MEMEMEVEIEMEVEMEMEMVNMVIFEAPKASWELRFTSKKRLTSDFEALEAAGAPKGDQETPRSPRRGPKSQSIGAVDRL